jgi:hypothetical protein
MLNSDCNTLIAFAMNARWPRKTSRGRQRFPAAIKAVLVLAVALAVMGKGACAQGMDSSTLQKEAEEDAAAKAAKPTQPLPASQGQQPQTAPAQDQPQAIPPAMVQTPTAEPQMNQTTLSQQQSGQGAQAANGAIMLPPGAKLPLGLLRPLKVKAGRDVYLQITFPVTVGSEMLVPPGTYIQGVVEKVIKKDRRHSALEFSIYSANMIFLNGYTVPISGTVKVATISAALQLQQQSQPGSGNGQPVPAMAAVGGPPALPPLPPLPDIGKGIRTAMIAVGVAAAVGTTAAVLIAYNRDPEVEVGTPLEIVLPAPLFLDAGRVAQAVQQYDRLTSNAPVQIVQPPVRPRMCYDPGSPGTPDTVIPGSSGTPDTVIPGMNGMPDTVIPGSPRTPDTVIPGTPGTPSSTYPCPR